MFKGPSSRVQVTGIPLEKNDNGDRQFHSPAVMKNSFSSYGVKKSKPSWWSW
jgi:hypothetical protein